MKEFRVFQVFQSQMSEEDSEAYPPEDWDDAKFMNEAERQGFVYTLKGFETTFNESEGLDVDSYIRVLEVEVSL